jgi:hypothetical protein
MASPGRPKKKIDIEQLKKMAGLGLSVAEIAALMDCSVDTIQRRFAKVIEAGRQRRNASLRRKQLELAMSGNATMCIWLGKQYLDQSDKRELAGKDGGPLQVDVGSIKLKDLTDEQLAAIAAQAGIGEESGPGSPENS